MELILVRGLPGSGKSTFAEKQKVLHYEGDQFFTDLKGNYNFTPFLLSEAHDWCYSNAARALFCGYDVVVSNTFTQLWELERYLALPSKMPNVIIKIYEMTGDYGTIHKVPEEKLRKMKSRWQEIPEGWNLNVIKVPQSS